MLSSLCKSSLHPQIAPIPSPTQPALIGPSSKIPEHPESVRHGSPRSRLCALSPDCHDEAAEAVRVAWPKLPKGSHGRFMSSFAREPQTRRRRSLLQKSSCRCFYKLGVLLVGVLVIRALSCDILSSCFFPFPWLPVISPATTFGASPRVLRRMPRNGHSKHKRCLTQLGRHQ